MNVFPNQGILPLQGPAKCPLPCCLQILLTSKDSGPVFHNKMGMSLLTMRQEISNLSTMYLKGRWVLLQFFSLKSIEGLHERDILLKEKRVKVITGTMPHDILKTEECRFCVQGLLCPY